MSFRVNKTSAPRSAVIHMCDVTGARLTACGLTIGDEWAGEYTEQPTGDVTCKRCLPHVAPINAAIAAAARFAIGQRVGILTGLQSVGGAWVGSIGTVTGYFTGWNSDVDYLVKADGENESYVYRSYLLTEVDDSALASDEVVENVAPVLLVKPAAPVRTDDIGTGHSVPPVLGMLHSPAGIRASVAADIERLLSGNPWNAPTTGEFHGTDFLTGEPVTLSVRSTDAYSAIERAASIARHPSGKTYKRHDGPFGGYMDKITGERVNRVRYPLVNTLGL